MRLHTAYTIHTHLPKYVNNTLNIQYLIFMIKEAVD